MKIISIAFLVLFCCFSIFWLFYICHDLSNIFLSTSFKTFSLISCFYLFSHLFRIVRLAIITLDNRAKIVPLATVHILTALPTLLIPFKLGEIIRLASFFYVFKDSRKALAVWLVERLSDVMVLILAILILYAAGISVSYQMKFIFIIFSIISIFFMIGLYAISRTFIYLNRFLVLTSRSKRGLVLLKISHTVWEFELTLKRIIYGRRSAIFLASVIIWMLEISALSIYLQNSSENLEDYGGLFATSLFNSLGNQIASITSGFGLYQSMILANLTILVSVVVLIKIFKRRGI